MLYRTLGRTGLRVSLAGLGTGGPSRLGQTAGIDPHQSHRLVHAALDLGINLFDSSPGYGASEELLGGALQGVPRDRYVLATKFPPYQGSDLKPDPESLTRQLEHSLRMLRVDAIDVLQYHGVAPESYREVIDRYHGVALRAQQAGKVRFLGITEVARSDPQHEMLAVALEDDLFDVTMVKYGILNQSAANSVLPLALRRNVGVLIMASVRTSLRTPQEAVAHINRFIAQGDLHMTPSGEQDPLGLAATGEPVPALTRAAYQFAAAHPAVSSVLIGTGNIEHLRANVVDLSGPALTPLQMGYLQRTFGGLTWEK
jgi:L-galactose dehydrogenase